MKKNDLCPCGSGQIYRECCQRFWATQQKPNTAEQLMRSRYTAFVLQKAQYLLDTHHPDFRESNALQTLKKSFKNTQWLGLQILDTQQGQTSDTQGIVEFKAHFKTLGQQQLLHERSSFVKEQGQWFYTNGTII